MQLVDTPGFNDTTRSDLDILSSIANWIYANKVAVAGVIYLHRITDMRFTGASRMNLSILKAMCGEHFFPYIILSSTMWSGLTDECEVAEAGARERELVGSPDIWNNMLQKGARYFRYIGSQESGQSIVHNLLARQNPPAMALELELRDRSLEDTVAGQLITAEIRKREEKLRQELLEEEDEERQLKEELKLEQEAIRIEAQRRRKQEEMIRQQAEARPSREMGGVDDMARRAAQVSWRFGTLNVELPIPFARR